MRSAHTTGDVLGGRYTLKRSAWVAPLGPVWEAHDDVLDRAVFVQLLDEGLADDPTVVKAFERNASAIAQVTHPNLTRVFDIGTNPSFVVFEHAPGGRLVDRLSRGALRPNEAARAALAIASGMEALHTAGLTHGSLGPTNILLDAEGRPRVLFLGTAATIGDERASAVQPSGYGPPEPAPPDARDRFALAALTFHMMTGKPPGETTARRLSIPSGIQSLLTESLSAEPTARPSLDSFVARLGPFARVEPPKARRPRSVAAEFRWLVPAIAIVVLAGLAITLGVGWISDLTTEDEPTASPTPTETLIPGQALPIADATDFDPFGSDGEERPERVPFAFDGDAGTHWRTLNYRSQTFDKAGVGLLFDLGEVRELTALEVETGLPGWKAQIRIGDEPPEEHTDFDRVRSFRARSGSVVADFEPVQARYVLLWIIEAARSDNEEFPFRAEVAEVRFRA